MAKAATKSRTATKGSARPAAKRATSKAAATSRRAAAAPQPKGRAHAQGSVTVDTLVKSIAAKRVADHPWFKTVFLTGEADAAALRRVAEQFVYVFDNIIELYGPMYLNNADYHVRRIFVDKMLTSIKLNTGSSLRLGEGAHAELATDLARALGVTIKDGQSAKPTPMVRERVTTLIASLERPAYWATLGAMAAVETQMRAVYKQMAGAFAQHYGVPATALRVFEAPLLFAKKDIEHCLAQTDTPFDRLLIAYYTERLRDEWYGIWDAAFRAAE